MLVETLELHRGLRLPFLRRFLNTFYLLCLFVSLEAERQHKEHQIDLAEQELKQVKSEIRTDKLKSVATDAATALASGVSSLFGSGKMKSLERKNEDLRDEIAIRNEAIEQLQSNIKQMQVEHSRAMINKENEHRKALEAKEAEHFGSPSLSLSFSFIACRLSAAGFPEIVRHARRPSERDETGKRLAAWF